MTSKTIKLNLTVSQEINVRLDELAISGQVTKSEVMHKAITLFDVVSQAKLEGRRFGILDRDGKLVTEIVGI